MKQEPHLPTLATRFTRYKNKAVATGWNVKTEDYYRHCEDPSVMAPVSCGEKVMQAWHRNISKAIRTVCILHTRCRLLRLISERGPDYLEQDQQVKLPWTRSAPNRLSMRFKI